MEKSAQAAADKHMRFDWNLITDCPALNFDEINSTIKFDDGPNAEMNLLFVRHKKTSH